MRASRRESREPLCLRGKQPVNAVTLGGAERADQQTPLASLHSIADAANKPFEGGDAWQQDLVGNQPRHRALEQHDRSVLAGPAQRVEPAGQAKARKSVVFEAAKPVALGNGRDMPPALTAHLVGTAVGFGKNAAELRFGGSDNAGGQIGETIGEAAQQPHGPELDRKAEPVLRAAQLLDDAAIGRVEMEMARQRVGGQLVREAAVAAALFGGEEAGRHVSQNFRLLRGRRQLRQRTGFRFAKGVCEMPGSCNMFRTAPRAAS